MTLQDIYHFAGPACIGLGVGNALSAFMGLDTRFGSVLVIIAGVVWFVGKFQ